MALILGPIIVPSPIDPCYDQKFKLVCDACGSLTIRVADPEQAAGTTIVECDRSHSPRGRGQPFVTSPGTGAAICEF